MKEMPHKFQFRQHQHTNFTHTAKLNARGDYEVNWARGWANVIGKVPIVVFDSNLAEDLIEAGSWKLVDDKPKHSTSSLPDRSASLPDEFYVQNCDSGNGYVMKRRYEGVWDIYYEDGVEKACPNHAYHSDQILNYFKSGSWKILDKRPLTSEQQRQVKAFREQIDALTSSIRIQEQSIEHYKRMVENYVARQDDLHEKIAELTGEDSPKIVKAKEMKAELGKLKKGNV